MVLLYCKQHTYFFLCFSFGEKIPAVQWYIINVHFGDNQLFRRGRDRYTLRDLRRMLIHMGKKVSLLIIAQIHYNDVDHLLK